MSGLPLTEKHRIQVGEPLPFSIFSADGKLLLAAGRVIESERMRDMLLRNGRYRSSMGTGDMRSGGGGPEGSSRGGRDANGTPEEEAPAPAGPPPTPLERMGKHYDSNGEGPRALVSIARGSDPDKAYTVQLLGAHAQMVMVTAPMNADGSLVPVQAGQSWSCRTFQMTSAFRFAAAATKVVFEPLAHLCLKLQTVEERRVRNAPRARVLLGGQLHATDEMPCFVTDLSATGARVAVDYPLALERGSTVRLAISIPMLASKRDLSLEALIVNALGPTEQRFPEVSFYGIQFKAPTELDSLALQAFVNGELVKESNSFWQMLSIASSPAAGGK